MTYEIKDVVGGFSSQVTGQELIPATLSRTYIEHSDIRDLTTRLNPFSTIYDIGCGFGRNIPVLLERGKVVGVERDKELCRIASKYNPGVTIHQTDTLSHINLQPCDFFMTFTVLQHIQGEEFNKVINELKRIHKGKYFLIVEETDVKNQAPEINGRHGVCGRSIQQYMGLFSEYKLARCVERELEPGSPYENGGHYLLFERI